MPVVPGTRAKARTSNMIGPRRCLSGLRASAKPDRLRLQAIAYMIHKCTNTGLNPDPARRDGDNDL